MSKNEVFEYGDRCPECENCPLGHDPNTCRIKCTDYMEWFGQAWREIQQYYGVRRDDV